jgi:hypothetical protein
LRDIFWYDKTNPYQVSTKVNNGLKIVDCTSFWVDYYNKSVISRKGPVPVTVLTPRMISCLELVTRETTLETEALAAWRLLRKDLSKLGVNWDDVINLTPRKRSDSSIADRKMIADLYQELQAKDAEIDKLKNMLKQNIALETETKKSDYDWIDFVNAGTARIRKSKGFQQAFLECNPQYKWGDLSGWRRLNKVPAEAMELLQNLVVSTEPARGRDWTSSEKDFLIKLIKEQPSIKMVDLAMKLSKEFGRTITEGAAKAAKKRCTY